MLNFETKNALFGYFWGRIFEKTILLFEISTLKFVSLQNFAKKTRLPKFGTKNTLLGIFEQECLIWVF